MSVELVSGVLLWCVIVSSGVLLAWFIVWTFASDSIYRLHSRWFHLDRATYEAATFHLFGKYKIGVWLFFIVPWLALQIGLALSG